MLLSWTLFSQQYEFESYQSNYAPITDYFSFCDNDLETSGYRLDFGFEFPHLDTVFHSIEITKPSIYSFYGVEESFSVALLNFIYDVHCYNNSSDIRIGFDTVEGHQVAIVEYINMHLANDDSVEKHNSGVTFQHWFYDNGNIEMHFGPHDIEHSEPYVEGEGFYLLNGPDTPLGPYIYILDYNTFEFEYLLGGPYDQLSDDPDTFPALTVWPPEGWIIKIRNTLSNVADIDTPAKLDISPNPSSGKVRVSFDKLFTGILNIRDLNGRTVISKTIHNLQLIEIDLSYLDNGIYVANFMESDGTFSNKRIVKTE